MSRAVVYLWAQLVSGALNVRRDMVPVIRATDHSTRLALSVAHTHADPGPSDVRVCVCLLHGAFLRRDASSRLASDLHDAARPWGPLLSTTLLWWNAHTVPLSSTWWNGLSFWPAPGTLGLSDHRLGESLIATPLQWAGFTVTDVDGLTGLASRLDLDQLSE